MDHERSSIHHPSVRIRQTYDPEGTGFMDAEILRSVFDSLGFGQMSDEDLAVLVEAADGDGDGRVSVEDFRGLCDSAHKREQAPNVKAEDADQAQANELS